MADPETKVLPPSLYINTMTVRHTPREFRFDFGQLTGQGAVAHLIASLVTSPAHAKDMLKALSDNIARYEAQFGEIRELQDISQIPKSESH